MATLERRKTKRCLRCGIDVWDGCCRDCHAVAPEHCKQLLANVRRVA